MKSAQKSVNYRQKGGGGRKLLLGRIATIQYSILKKDMAFEKNS